MTKIIEARGVISAADATASRPRARVLVHKWQ